MREQVQFFFSSRRRHTRSYGDWSSDVCSSDLRGTIKAQARGKPHWSRHFTALLRTPRGPKRRPGPGAVAIRQNCAMNREAKKARSEERRVGKEGKRRWWVTD